MKKPLLSVAVFLFLILAGSASLATANAATYEIYAGESATSTTKMGFGNNDTTMLIPGPTMVFTSGETVTVILHNIGSGPHTWAIVDTDDQVLWGAQIGSDSNPIQGQSNGSVTFTVDTPGNYRYVSQYFFDEIYGMHGNVVVQAAIPEFPAPLLVAFLALAVTALAVFLKRKR
jgi:plastocyanin